MLPRCIRFRLLAALLCFLPLPAFAATSISGTVTDKTTGKPSAGDEVVLLRLQQTMEETTRAKTDAHGHYTLAVPDDGMHLVRVTHQNASYFQPVQPGVNTVNLDVYDASSHVDGVSTTVEELHVEATATELHIVEVLQVLNQSSPARTQLSPGGFDFYLPSASHIVRAGAQRDGMPVPATAVPLGDPGHYAFQFPIRPGETQFGIFYTLPYSGQGDIDLKMASAVSTVAVMLPRSIQFKSAGSAPWKISNEGQPAGVQMWAAQNIAAGQTLSFTISGTGTLPAEGARAGQGDQAAGQTLPETENTAPGRGLQNPLDPEGDRTPLDKYKWWILSGLAFLLVLAAGILLRRRPSASQAASVDVPPGGIYAPTSAGSSTHPRPGAEPLEALKEELFALETDHLQQRITEAEYLEHKAALELVLRRALARTGASQGRFAEPTPEEVAR